MPELELRHLRVVCTVVDAGSLSRAAAQLGVSQPALTAQLQRIERQLGGRLFERTREGMTPTELGDFLVSGARVVLADMAHLVSGVAERVQPRGSGSTVLVAGSAGPLAPLFAARLRHALQLPQVGTEVEAGTRSLYRLVQSGRADFAIVEMWRDLPHRVPEPLRSRWLVAEPAFVALPEEHPLGQREAVALADLAEEDWAVVPPTESGEQLALQRACAKVGFTPRIRHHTTESSSARELVRSGVVTLAHPASRQGDGVTVRPLLDSPMLVDLLLVWLPGAPMAGQVDVAYRCAAQAYLSLVERSPSFQRWWDEHPEAHAELDRVVREGG